MKKLIGLILILLPLVLLGQRCAQAGPLGVAGDYNVFVFGNIEQWGTDVEGRVAAGGIAAFGRPDVLPGDHNGFAIASKIALPANNLVAGNTVLLKNGSIGYLDLSTGSGGSTSQNGNIVYGAAVAPVIPPDVGYGFLQNATPIDFVKEQNYLTALSDNLGNLASTGTTQFLKNDLGATFEIRLDGTNAGLNIFSLQAGDITQNLAFKFFAPETSTILVNIAGGAASLKNFGFYFNDIKGEDEDPVTLQPIHPGGYPYSHILFNFMDATLISIDDIAIDGSILAPLAHIDFGENSHIDGNLIAASLTGMGESHNRLFTGIVPTSVPEPATLLLLAAGLAGLAARRRRTAAGSPGHCRAHR